jgi:putative transposase
LPAEPNGLPAVGADLGLLRRLARLHEHIAHLRRDCWHQLTHWRLHTCGLIALAALSLNFMLRNQRLALSAHNAGLFRRLLDYKAVEAGSHLTFVNLANTSQVCSRCGGMVEKDLSVRVHRCPVCFLELDRDLNAARNILKRAFSSPQRAVRP